VSVMGCRSAFETNNGPIRFDHERVELIKGIDTPNGKAHFVVARETPINADMRVSRQWQSVVEVHFFSAPTSRQFSATGTNNRSKSDMWPMPPHRQFEPLHRPPAATHRQPNTASKCQVARERCPKALALKCTVANRRLDLRIGVQVVVHGVSSGCLRLRPASR
jgi:hypothetical protein